MTRWMCRIGSATKIMSMPLCFTYCGKIGQPTEQLYVRRAETVETAIVEESCNPDARVGTLSYPVGKRQTDLVAAGEHGQTRARTAQRCALLELVEAHFERDQERRRQQHP